MDFRRSSSKNPIYNMAVFDIIRVAKLFMISSIFFGSFPPNIALSFQFFQKLPLPSSAVGSHSVAFDALGQGPYTGVENGRILKYQGPSVGFQDFAFDSLNRSKAVCDGNTNPALTGTCGRPAILLSDERALHNRYVSWALCGRPSWRPCKTGCCQCRGSAFPLSRCELQQAIDVNDSTGRVLKYDIKTKKVTTLLRGLIGSNGVALSKDKTYLLISEFIGRRIQKYWLKGLRANTSEILINLPGRPGHIQRTSSGDFWVAFNLQPKATQPSVPRALKIDGFGRILAIISLAAQFNNTLITEVQEYGGAVYVGSLTADFIESIIKFD